MKQSIKIIVTIILIQCSCIVYAQNKINQSIQELKTESEKSDSKNEYKTTTNRSGRESSSSSESMESSIISNRYENSSVSLDDEPSGNFFSNLLGTIISYITYYTFIGSYELEDHLHYDLTKYPYFDHESGNYFDYCPMPDSENSSSSIAHFRLDLEDKYLMSSKNSFGNHLKVKIRPFKYAYLQVDYFELIEKNTTYNGQSNLSLFNFNVCYDRVRFENFNLGFTLGANYIANDIKKAGFTYGLNLEAFLFNPLSLNCSYKWSNVNKLPVNEFEIGLKYFIKNIFVTAGYESFKIASPTYNFFTAGVGLQFYK